MFCLARVVISTDLFTSVREKCTILNSAKLSELSSMRSQEIFLKNNRKLRNSHGVNIYHFFINCQTQINRQCSTDERF